MKYFKWISIDSTLTIKCNNVMTTCEKLHMKMVPKLGFIDIKDQAKMWKQSRTKKEINNKVDELKFANCEFLSDILLNTKYVEKDWETNLIPGMSWHNWGREVIFDTSEEADIERILELCGEYDLYAHATYRHKGYDLSVSTEREQVSKTMSLIEVNDYFKNKFEKR